MKRNESSTVKLSDYRLGGLFRKIDEIRRRIASGALDYDETMEALQLVVENKGYIMTKVVKGLAELTDIPYIVNLDAQPKTLTGYKASAHNGGGVFNFQHQSLDLFYPNPERENGYKIRSALEGPLNANMLDFLLGHPELIPQECQGKYTCFFGTTYCSYRDDESFVRAIFYHQDRYQETLIPLDTDFGDEMPIMIIKKEGES